MRYMKKAFEIEKKKFNASALSSNNLSVTQAKSVFDELVSLRLGKLTIEVSEKNHRRAN